MTLELEKNTTIEKVNNLFKSNQSDTLKYTEDPIVSSDIIGDEVGYTAQMIRTMKLFM